MLAFSFAYMCALFCFASHKIFELVVQDFCMFLRIFAVFFITTIVLLRRCDRASIKSKLLRQWRGLAMAARPLPPPNRRDSGLVCYGVWGDGLQGVDLISK